MHFVGLVIYVYLRIIQKKCIDVTIALKGSANKKATYKSKWLFICRYKSK